MTLKRSDMTVSDRRTLSTALQSRAGSKYISSSSIQTDWLSRMGTDPVTEEGIELSDTEEQNR